MSATCRCSAYKYPHRRGGGFCNAPRFVCECGAGFDEPRRANYRAATRDEPEEYTIHCPECGSEDFNEEG